MPVEVVGWGPHVTDLLDRLGQGATLAAFIGFLVVLLLAWIAIVVSFRR